MIQNSYLNKYYSAEIALEHPSTEDLRFFPILEDKIFFAQIQQIAVIRYNWLRLFLAAKGSSICVHVGWLVYFLFVFLSNTSLNLIKK